MDRQPHEARAQVLAELEKDVWLADFDTETFTLLSVPNGLQRHDLHRRSERANAAPKQRLGAGRVLLRCLVCLLTAALLAAMLAAGAVGVICLGPSEQARIELVRQTANHPVLSFIPHIFFSQAQIDGMLAEDAHALVLESNDPQTPPPAQTQVALQYISGTGFTGTMLSVTDPSLIRVSAISSFSTAKEGATLADLIGQQDVAAVSGGLFYRQDSNGKGGMPTGVVIQEGQLRRAASTVTVAGFDGNGVLSVARQTGKQAQTSGVVNGVAAQAALILDGQMQTVDDQTVAARTAVAQLQDGSVIFVCINANAPNSVGITVHQLQQLLLQHGAVTAALLNSGDSCSMLYQQQLVSGESSQLPRLIPTAFVVGGAV